MEQRQSRRLRGLDAEIVPETASDQHCIFCLIDEHHGFNIIAGNVLRFPCCKTFAHRSCQRKWERISPLCPHCRRELPNEENDQLLVEAIEPRNGQISPRQQEINALQAAIQDREGVQRRMNEVSFTFIFKHAVSFKVNLITMCVLWVSDKPTLVLCAWSKIKRILQAHCYYQLTFAKH